MVTVLSEEIGQSLPTVHRKLLFVFNHLFVATAPVVGQLVPMAIPLRKPRMDPGLAVAPDDQPYPVSVEPTDSPVRPVVTADTNVAMVAITTDADGPVPERVPELGKQVGLCLGRWSVLAVGGEGGAELVVGYGAHCSQSQLL